MTPDKSSNSTVMPSCSSTAATFKIPSDMNTRSSSRKRDGGMMRQIRWIIVSPDRSGGHLTIDHWMRSWQGKKAPLQDGPEHDHTVPPGDFFPLRVGAWIVLDRNFADPHAFAHQFADQFVVELKSR